MTQDAVSDYEQIEAVAFRLLPDQRQRLMLRLFMSLEPTMIQPFDEEAIEALWLEEVERRIADVRSGRTKVFSYEEAMQTLEARRKEIGDQRRTEDTTSVKALDTAWNQAYQRKDVAQLERILPDDWMGFTADQQQISKAMILEAVRTNPEATLEFDEFAVYLFGHVAITRGRLMAVGADHVHQQRFLRMYQKRHEGWRPVAVQVIPAHPV